MDTLILANAVLFLSTLSLRRATGYEQYYIHAPGISIHALLAESDFKISENLTNRKYFYPRSPCGERHSQPQPHCHQQTFLSTLSLRRATSQHAPGTTSTTYFYPRSPCGERLLLALMISLLVSFLSTLSLRRATSEVSERVPLAEISIHALLAESDHLKTSGHPHKTNFYPRSPCGERL